jgi:hypothetical protein
LSLRTAIAACAIGLAIGYIFFVADSGRATVQQSGTTGTCASGLSASKIRVCTAYSANAASGSLVPYYKWGRSPNTSRVEAVTHRLETRYTAAARRLIKTRVAAWPKGNYAVRYRISIRAVKLNNAGNRATLTTVESWRVFNGNDRTLFQEDRVRHAISMRKIEGLFGFGRWVVSRIN